MKRLTTLCMLLMLCLGRAWAADIMYTYHPMQEDGCKVYFAPVEKDGQYFLEVKVESDQYQWGDTAEMKLVAFGGYEIYLRTTSVGNAKKSAPNRKVKVPLSSMSCKAVFPINLEQIEALKEGITYVHLNTTPVHERVGERDKIGKKLHSAFRMMMQ